MIRIICVGKLKEELKVISENYFKRIQKFTKIEIIEINEYKSQDIKESLKKEGVRILEKIDNDFIALDNNGKQFSSREFSELIEPNMTFIIGSHAGLSKDIKEKAKLRFSLSKMTLPHQITRIILLEQIYRALSIKNNQPYHK